MKPDVKVKPTMPDEVPRNDSRQKKELGTVKLYRSGPTCDET